MIARLHSEGAKGAGSPSGAAMAEALGQKSLLGLGVLLAWLLLFHLLVNIWLLCVITSLLVVFGGWLTSQAILESTNLVHLERFISLEQVSQRRGGGVFSLTAIFHLQRLFYRLNSRFRPPRRMNAGWTRRFTAP